MSFETVLQSFINGGSLLKKSPAKLTMWMDQTIPGTPKEARESYDIMLL